MTEERLLEINKELLKELFDAYGQYDDGDYDDYIHSILTDDEIKELDVEQYLNQRSEYE